MYTKIVNSLKSYIKNYYSGRYQGDWVVMNTNKGEYSTVINLKEDYFGVGVYGASIQAVKNQDGTIGVKRVRSNGYMDDFIGNLVDGKVKGFKSAVSSVFKDFRTASLVIGFSVVKSSCGHYTVAGIYIYGFRGTNYIKGDVLSKDTGRQALATLSKDLLNPLSSVLKERGLGNQHFILNYSTYKSPSRGYRLTLSNTANITSEILYSKSRLYVEGTSSILNELPNNLSMVCNMFDYFNKVEGLLGMVVGFKYDFSTNYMVFKLYDGDKVVKMELAYE